MNKGFGDGSQKFNKNLQIPYSIFYKSGMKNERNQI